MRWWSSQSKPIWPKQYKSGQACLQRNGIDLSHKDRPHPATILKIWLLHSIEVLLPMVMAFVMLVFIEWAYTSGCFHSCDVLLSTRPFMVTSFWEQSFPKWFIPPEFQVVMFHITEMWDYANNFLGSFICGNPASAAIVRYVTQIFSTWFLTTMHLTAGRFPINDGKSRGIVQIPLLPSESKSGTAQWIETVNGCVI